jgi:hypothetical protein
MVVAMELFRLAVDRLVNSPFHNGKNDQGRQYTDWHQLFTSKGYSSPRKLLEFWLEDSNWEKQENSSPATARVNAAPDAAVRIRLGGDSGADSPEMVAAGVLTELGITNRWVSISLEGICKSELSAGKDATALRDELIAAWRAYGAAGDKIEFRQGPEKFFGDGTWRNRDLWRWREGQQPKPKRPDALALQKAERAALEADERARGLR